MIVLPSNLLFVTGVNRLSPAILTFTFVLEFDSSTRLSNPILVVIP